MSNHSKIESLPRENYPPRRSISVGDTSSSAVEENQPTNYQQYLKPDDDDGYVCAPLPRTNHRPTAATCWLVIFAIPLLQNQRKAKHVFQCILSFASPNSAFFYYR